MKKLSLGLILLFCVGCAFLDILEPIPTPKPVCNADSIGAQWQGKVCLQFSDGSYKWTERNGKSN